jgi:hypothetical protein
MLLLLLQVATLQEHIDLIGVIWLLQQQQQQQQQIEQQQQQQQQNLLLKRAGLLRSTPALLLAH